MFGALLVGGPIVISMMANARPRPEPRKICGILALRLKRMESTPRTIAWQQAYSEFRSAMGDEFRARFAAAELTYGGPPNPQWSREYEGHFKAEAD